MWGLSSWNSGLGSSGWGTDVGYGSTYASSCFAYNATFFWSFNWHHSFWCYQDYTPTVYELPQVKARPVDGMNNNAVNPVWGSAGVELLRLAGDSRGPNGELADADLPNAREISNAVAQQTGDTVNAAGASDFLWMWGQFLDHDLSLTEAGTTQTANIEVPMGDPFFDPFFTGKVEIPFNRVDPHDGAYVNEITAYIDASMIYGSDSGTVDSMRIEGGKLLMTETAQLELEGANLVTGDVRAAENVGLSSLHTIFTREHNRMVDELAEQHPTWDDDRLFETARAHVEGVVQAITYNDFLPILVGQDAIAAYDGYDETVNVGISVEFSTAVYRLGHTLLSSNLQKVSEDGGIKDPLALRDAFFRPSLLQEPDMIEDIFRGAATQTAQAVDTMVVEDVRSFLFGPPGAGGFDLAALNVQRGRDLGVASYNDLREAVGLDRAQTFADLTSDATLAARLQSVYADVDQVDAWVGGLAEDPMEGALLGELFSVVMIDQFTRVRDGDAYWSEDREGLTQAQIDDIWDTSLADVILRNTDIDVIQTDVFTAMTRIIGDDGTNILDGTDTADFMVGYAGNDTLFGNAGDDELRGDGGRDRLIAGDGDDLLFGGNGNDVLRGGAGNDEMFGGAGRDLFEEISGDDVITGGSGRDTFVFTRDHAGNTEITDFKIWSDNIDFVGFRFHSVSYAEVGKDAVLTLDHNSTITLTDMADEMNVYTWWWTTEAYL